ncbi:histidine ammonia-lyase [Polyangium sp. 6x1]|uniref:histidine ammonia-lyase n=1 Tax=Polyangium sp. 6x1 TaxID=3042689 RepID=UPI002482F7C6|nr:histidine ammonia-lyase [Polyangium sp. 6x1]MDI1443022.1 histidine ammonia-lyase [Polyangium sp. 6x1]
MSIESKTTRSITLDFYSLGDLRAIVEERPRLALDASVAEKIDAGAQYVQRKAQEDRYIYGVNTGFGSLCETRVKADEVETLQYNHVVSHACGVGDPVSEDVSRLVMLIKLLTFRTGHTGVSLETVQRLVDFWNHDVIPVIPKKGTVGASGDLAPLAHLSLPLLGLGKVHFEGRIVPAAEALSKLGWDRLRLKAKEGLALTNGVQYINAIAAECLMDVGDLVGCADMLAAVSVQAFSASRTFYQAPYHETSYHLERRAVAANLRKLLEGSNHFELPTCNRSMQDPYSFRCIPQVHGAVRQAYGFAKTTMENEVNGVSDNPLFFPEQDLILFGGNLHGESTALALDFLAMATSEIASISERRTYQLLSGQRGLPSFLVHEPGLNSGLMIPQYTSAALVNQNKVLSTPASVDTIPTCQLQEDHVSMGGTSAYKLQEIVQNCWWVFAIELLTAAQAVEFNRGLRLSPITEGIVQQFRGEVSFLERDRVMSDDIEKAHDFLMHRAPAWVREWSLL